MLLYVSTSTLRYIMIPVCSLGLGYKYRFDGFKLTKDEKWLDPLHKFIVNFGAYCAAYGEQSPFSPASGKESGPKLRFPKICDH